MKKSSRRKFVRQAGMAALVPFTLTNGSSGEADELKNVFIHQVYFWLKNPGNTTDREKLTEGLKKYLTGIEVLAIILACLPALLARWLIAATTFPGWLFSKTKQHRMHIRCIRTTKSLWTNTVPFLKRSSSMIPSMPKPP